MAALRRDKIASDFFGADEDVLSSPPPTGRIAIARDNARLFVGNIINNYPENQKRTAFSIDGVSMTSTAFTDPLTLTTSVLVAVTRAVDTLRSCQRYAARLKIADLSIASLHTECSTIRLSLHQIKSLMTRDGDKALEDRFEAYVLEEYDDVLQACCLPFSVLNRHLGNLGFTQMNEMDRSTFKTKLQSIWVNQQMEMISQHIGGLARAINILCTAFQSETAVKTSEIMRSPEAKRVLASVSSDAISLHDSFHTAPGFDEESTRGSVIGDEVFGFDEILTSTTLYRRIYARNMVKSQQREIQDPVLTEAGGPSSSEAPLEYPMPFMYRSNTIPGHSPFMTQEPTNHFAEEPKSNSDQKPESTFEIATSDWESSIQHTFFPDETRPTGLQKNPATTTVERIKAPGDPPSLGVLPNIVTELDGEDSVGISDPVRPDIEESASQREHRNLVDSQSSDDTIPARATPRANDNLMPNPAHGSELDSVSESLSNLDLLRPGSSPVARHPPSRSPPAPPPVKISRLEDQVVSPLLSTYIHISKTGRVNSENELMDISGRGVVIDTASPANCINEATLKGTNYEHYVKGYKGRQLQGLVWWAVKPKGIVTLKFKFEGTKLTHYYEADFLVIGKRFRAQFDCLLGWPWLEQNGFGLVQNREGRIRICSDG